MKYQMKLIILIILIIFSYLSCENQGIKSTSVEERIEEEVNKLEYNKELLNPGEYFATSILGNNLGEIAINSSKNKHLNYKQIFCKEGLSDIVAYYDKRINPSSTPTEFEDFLLFVASYDNVSNAKSSFERIKSDAEICNSTENQKLDQILAKRIGLLRLGNDFGGLITNNEKQVFSLIEKCNYLPIGQSWLELEYRFTDLLKNENGFVDVLKSGCEEGRYYGGRRKANL